MNQRRKMFGVAWATQEALSQNLEPKSYRTLTQDWGFKRDRGAGNVVNDSVRTYKM